MMLLKLCEYFPYDQRWYFTSLIQMLAKYDFLTQKNYNRKIKKKNIEYYALIKYYSRLIYILIFLFE